MTTKCVVRTAMTEFWQEHSQEGSLTEMMLDHNAEELCEKELPEILSYLPPWAGTDILELGAGIGRFTGALAKLAKSVTAVDFMEKFVEKNRENNASYKNIDFRCADVTQIKLLNNSCDIIFSNWLLMYLENKELEKLIGNMLLWLRDGGYLFCRESCNQQSGNKATKNNPTHYRQLIEYDAFFSSITVPTEDGKGVYGFDLVLSRNVDAYVKLKGNQHQIIWLLQKSRQTEHKNGFKTFQEFLDNQQYSRNSILRYEKIYGHSYISSGGRDTTKEILSMLNLQPGQTVLDVGCGIGGSTFYMVKECGMKVLAVDLSSNMIDIGKDRAQELGLEDQVQFEHADATKRIYPDESFHVIYSRDTILHIADKLALFKLFYKCLRPGGKVLISDYCCSEGEHTEQFTSYIKQRGYNLLSPAKYGKVLKEAGFVNVWVEDRTDLFVECLKKELKVAVSIKDEFIQEFSQDDYMYIVDGWKDKIARTSQGEQRWGLFYAEKP